MQDRREVTLMQPYLTVLLRRAFVWCQFRLSWCVRPGVSWPGRCEKIDLQTWSPVGAEKSRSRMPYERPLGCRHTFRIKTEIAKTQPNQFFHIFQTDLTLSETLVDETSVKAAAPSVHSLHVSIT